MSYIDKVIGSIEAVYNRVEDETFESEFIEEIEVIFLSELSNSKKVGISLESIIYETLEGIETGLKKLKKDELQKYLNIASNSMVDMLYKCANKNINHKQKEIDIATHRYHDAIDREKEHLKESLESFKNYAKDHKYENFQIDLDYYDDFLKNIIYKTVNN